MKGLSSSTATTVTTGEELPALKGKDLQEIVAKWNQDLELQTREFHKLANQIERWDREVLENGSRISKVHQQLQETQSKQKSIDQSLEYIEAQQNELDSALESFHSQIKTLVDGPEGQARLKYIFKSNI